MISRGLSRALLWLTPILIFQGTSTADENAATPPLILEGMTFVASSEESSELVLRAEKARFELDDDMAYLERVHATLIERGEEKSESAQDLDLRCDRGELDLETNDFLAQGNVSGRTEAGREFSAEWVRYEHKAGLLYTDAPVVIREGLGTFRGGGFRYYVRDHRFRLLGGASVVQE